jgi:hypothetical protein
MNQAYKIQRKSCPYRVNWVNHNCHHKQNPKHVCKARNCPLLPENVIMAIKPNWGDSSPVSASLKPILKTSKPILIETEQGLVQLKDWKPSGEGWHGNLGKRRKR